MNRFDRDLVVLDTSVWINYTNFPASSYRVAVDRLIDIDRIATTGIVIAEVLQGARSKEDYPELSNMLRGPHFLDATRETYESAGELSFRLRRQGQQIPMSDVIIAATAIEFGCPVFSDDAHFDRIPELTLYEPGDLP